MDLSVATSGKQTKDQVTSEQLLQDAYSENNNNWKRPVQNIQDLDELRSYQLTKRAEYEQQLNKNRLNFGQWLRYARWEVEHNHDFARARSIYERALDVNVQHIPFWIHYIQFELLHRNINHARNLLDRGVTVLPRVDKLWYLYVQTEETLKNYQMVRQIFERWLTWKPNSGAWDAYINFERRYDEHENVRNIYLRYVQDHGEGETWLKWIEFETNDAPINSKQISRIRYLYEFSVDTLLSRENDHGHVLPLIISKWTDWEVSVKEYERARAIYRLILNDKDNKIILPLESKKKIRQSYTEFEKAFGNKDIIEISILEKRKAKYEEELQENPHDYDTWWLYIDIIYQENNVELLRSVFERATSIVPIDKNKSMSWRRYILLYIRFALWEEFDNNEIQNARAIWKKCTSIIPHKTFTFGKVWIHFANFEIRNDHIHGLSNARKILGRSIGQSSQNKPKKNIFKFYVRLEKQLGEWDRARKIFEKWLEVSISSEVDQTGMEVFLSYIDFEKSLQEFERCVTIYRLGLSLLESEMIPKKLSQTDEFKVSFINFYKDEMKYNEARNLYKEYLAKWPDTKLWISYALFESSIPTEDQLKIYEEGEEEEFEFSINETHKENSRRVFQQANIYYKDKDMVEPRIVILEAWKEYEKQNGTEESLKAVVDKIPTIIKRRKLVDDIEEEYLDYLFPEDQIQKKIPTPGINKFLENAKKWALSN